MEEKILIIDDNPQRQMVQTNIVNPAEENGITIKPIYFNPSISAYTNPERDIDPELVKKGILSITEHNNFVVIATDFNYGDDNVSGIEMIQYIQQGNRNKHTPIVLYSGTQTQVVKSIKSKCLEQCDDCPESCKSNCKHNGERINEEAFTNEILSFIKLNITNFVKRENYSQAVNSILKRSRSDFKYQLIEKLKTHGEMKFKSIYKNFEEQTLDMIANEIQKKTLQGTDFQKELVDIIVDNLIELNQIEKK